VRINEHKLQGNQLDGKFILRQQSIGDAEREGRREGDVCHASGASELLQLFFDDKYN
jgi:hypothetical protein